MQACYVAPYSLSARGSLSAGHFSACFVTPRRPAPCVALPHRQTVSMGLFGLGLPEIAVIAGVGILIFGPSKIATIGKDLGGIAGSVKKATSEFQEAMSDSLADADREIEERKMKKPIEIKSVSGGTDSEFVDVDVNADSPEAEKTRSS
jgi:sec-independent protein translocase protein TatA